MAPTPQTKCSLKSMALVPSAPSFLEQQLHLDWKLAVPLFMRGLLINGVLASFARSLLQGGRRGTRDSKGAISSGRGLIILAEGLGRARSRAAELRG